ncbi:MAG: PD40 domain-containing protein [Nitrospinae bacterium]|nr:PD40 domain-containing protein [Nitrospinota bacterium]
MLIKKSNKVFLYVILLLFYFLYSSNSFAKDLLIFEGKIVFQSQFEVGKGTDIYILNGKSGKVKRLTKTKNNEQPKWSSDGKKIAFVSTRHKDNNMEIYLMNTDGTNQRRLTYTPSIVDVLGKQKFPHLSTNFSQMPQWDNNGKNIYFSSGLPASPLQENMVNVETSQQQVILPYTERDKFYQIIPSPDKKKELRYFKYLRKMSLVDISTKSSKDIGFDAGDLPAWSKDGKKIAYLKGEIPGKALVIFDVEQNKVFELADVRRDYSDWCNSISWSPDSKHLVYACGMETGPDVSKIYILDIESGVPIKITEGSSPDWY